MNDEQDSIFEPERQPIIDEDNVLGNTEIQINSHAIIKDNESVITGVTSEISDSTT